MLPFSRLLDALKQIPDPRRDQGKRYPLPYLLLFSILAILSGARGFSDIIIFMEQRLNALNEVFGINLKRAPTPCASSCTRLIATALKRLSARMPRAC